MISPSFMAEIQRQQDVARGDLAAAEAAGDDSAAVAARARLNDLDDIHARTVEGPLLVA